MFVKWHNFLYIYIYIYISISVWRVTGNTGEEEQNTENKIKTEHNPDTIKSDEHFYVCVQDFPWSGRRLGRCAVVGSGGILKNSSCGREIDSADFVIRFNLASINDSDVGLKTDLVTINPSQIQRESRVSVYGNTSLIMPAFAYTFCTGLSIKTLKALHPIRPQQPVVFFSPYYLQTLDHFWKGRGLKSIRLSTGFMLISTALELCENVHVYGFWPFDTDLQDNLVPYHYYDLRRPSKSMHKMPEEFVRLLQLHSQGALTLHLQN
uniref:ST8 alpha-N-acetyl-neuraminide alpha-2,8-sialyltransferase 7.1 n=1 Tax=Sinocyclocheilus anshuiensis TaxID=1608454 RepID=A0A671SFQ8_9TELE